MDVGSLLSLQGMLLTQLSLPPQTSVLAHEDLRQSFFGEENITPTIGGSSDNVITSWGVWKLRG